MKQRSLGCTDTKLSELCLGTMNFGWRISASTSRAILDAYHAAGGNFIQALAPVPGVGGGPAAVAAPEALVGDWWRARGHPRGALFLATRIHLPGTDQPSDLAVTAMLRRAVDDSLGRFQTDYLDLLVCEWSAPARVAPALRQALDGLVRTGRVRYVAFAGLPAWQLVAEIHRDPRANHSRIDAIQADYSLLARAAVEGELGGACAAYRLGLIVRSPLAGGLLAKRDGNTLALGPTRLRWLISRYGSDGGAKVVRVVNQLAAAHDCTPAQVALAWVLHQPSVTSALIGVNSVALLRELVDASRCKLSAVDLDRLDRASTTQRAHLPPRRAPAFADHAGFTARATNKRDSNLQTA